MGLPYGCNHQNCGKRYATVHSLDYHLRTHSGFKPFVCGCGKKFSKKQTLDYHLYRAKKPCSNANTAVAGGNGGDTSPSGVAVFPCSHVSCPAVFSTQLEYRRHFSSHVDQWMAEQLSEPASTADAEQDAALPQPTKKRKRS